MKNKRGRNHTPHDVDERQQNAGGDSFAFEFENLFEFGNDVTVYLSPVVKIGGRQEPFGPQKL